jgi:hypothetical protein
LLSRPNKASADQQIALRSLIGDVKRAIAQLAAAEGRLLSIRDELFGRAQLPRNRQVRHVIKASV